MTGLSPLLVGLLFNCLALHPDTNPQPLPGVPADAPFLIVAYPDTQFYCETAAWTHHFTAQTQWTKDWRIPYNIAFATHLGDIVQNGANNGNLIEWQRASAAIGTLDTILPQGLFPYGVCLGNHDFAVISDKNSGSAVYDQFFGPTRYAGRVWYAGYSPDRQNHAQLFTAGGRTYLHLTLEWRPDTAAFQWAQSIINAHPGMPTICSTHEHVNDADTNGAGAGLSTYGVTTWINLIRNNPQIFMFLNGHFASGVPNHNGEHAIVGINAAGREVFEMLSDYQNWTEGGSGYMRMIRLDERNSIISVRSFSPSLSLYQSDWNSQFRYVFDFANRFDGTAPMFGTLTFRNGYGGYSGTDDAELNSATPTVANGAASVLTIANADGTPAGPTNTLIKFNNLFGNSTGQIASDHDVVLAKLRVAVVDSGSGFMLHDLLTDWTEASTWTSVGGGIQADGVKALSAPVAIAGAAYNGNLLPLSTIELDVTSSLRSYLNGATNRGWAMLPFATANGVDIVSSESGDFLNRPQLVVTTTNDPVSLAVFQQGIAGYSATSDTELRQSAPTVNSGNNDTLFIDASDPNGTLQRRQGLLRFDNIFGSGPSQIQSGSRVTSAMLILNITEEGSGFELHRMLTPWTEASTWDSLVSGVGADDVEAHRWTEFACGIASDGPWVKPGRLFVDVTDSVQAWERGEANWGWALLPLANGNNGLRIASSEFATATSRPMLAVRYVAQVTCVGDFNNDGGIDGGDIASFFAAWEAGDTSADINLDGGVDGNDISDFFGHWSAGC